MNRFFAFFLLSFLFHLGVGALLVSRTGFLRGVGEESIQLEEALLPSPALPGEVKPPAEPVLKEEGAVNTKKLKSKTKAFVKQSKAVSAKLKKPAPSAENKRTKQANKKPVPSAVTKQANKKPAPSAVTKQANKKSAGLPSAENKQANKKPLQGKGPLQGEGPLQGKEPLQGEESLQDSEKLKEKKSLPSAGTLPIGEEQKKPLKEQKPEWMDEEDLIESPVSQTPKKTQNPAPYAEEDRIKNPVSSKETKKEKSPAEVKNSVSSQGPEKAQKSAPPVKNVSKPEALKTAEDLEKAGGLKKGIRTYKQLRQIEGNPLPVYPKEALKKKWEGRVDLFYYVNPAGFVEKIQLQRSSGHSVLDNSALRALSRYRYHPGQEGWVRHPVEFLLDMEKEIKQRAVLGVRPPTAKAQ